MANIQRMNKVAWLEKMPGNGIWRSVLREEDRATKLILLSVGLFGIYSLDSAQMVVEWAAYSDGLVLNEVSPIGNMSMLGSDRRQQWMEATVNWLGC